MILRAVVGILITVLVLAFAGKRLWFLVSLARSGKPAVGRTQDAPKRVEAEATEVLGQKKLLKWTVPGIAHVFAFWGFLVLGLTILEAMALSRPVVASNVGGIPEMVEDGVTGLLVPPHDPAALAAAIVRLLTDHPYADTLARAGHDLVHDRFCLELMVHGVEAIYDEGARATRLRPVASAAAG